MTKKQRVLDFAAARGWTSIGEAEWNELKAALPDVSETTIRRAGIPNDQLHDFRAVLLDKEGVRRHVQGKITGEQEKRYLNVETLHRDFFLSRYEEWPQTGEIAHAYIAFAFAGPRAVQSL